MATLSTVYTVRPRKRGQWVAEVRGLGMAPVLQHLYFDTKTGTYSDPLEVKTDLPVADLVQAQIDAVAANGGHALLQRGKWNAAHTALEFDGWIGLFRIEDAHVNDAGGFACRIVERLGEAR